MFGGGVGWARIIWACIVVRTTCMIDLGLKASDAVVFPKSFQVAHLKKKNADNYEVYDIRMYVYPITISTQTLDYSMH